MNTSRIYVGGGGKITLTLGRVDQEPLVLELHRGYRNCVPLIGTQGSDMSRESHRHEYHHKRQSKEVTLG